MFINVLFDFFLPQKSDIEAVGAFGGVASVHVTVGASNLRGGVSAFIAGCGGRLGGRCDANAPGAPFCTHRKGRIQGIFPLGFFLEFLSQHG